MESIAIWVRLLIQLCCASYEGLFPSFLGLRQKSGDKSLLTYAKAAENLPEQVITGKSTGDSPQGILGQSKILGH